MAVNDSFSIKFKCKSGKWGWSLSVFGLRLEVDYYKAKELVRNLSFDYPVVVLFNNSQNHISEIHFGQLHEILHCEFCNMR